MSDDIRMTPRVGDAHVHLFASGYVGELGVSICGVDELNVYQHLRKRYGIEDALVVAFEGEARYSGNNDYVVGLASDHPWIHPLMYRRPGDGRDTLKDIASGAVGVAIYPAFSDSGDFVPWLGKVMVDLDRVRGIVSVNAAPAHYASVLRAVGDLHRIQVLFSHLGLPGEGTTAGSEDAWAELVRRPNVHVKVSGLYAVASPQHRYPHPQANGLVTALLNLVGAARLLWGSDFAPAFDHVSFPQTLDPPALQKLDDEQRDAVFGGNLRRLVEQVGGAEVPR